MSLGVKTALIAVVLIIISDKVNCQVLDEIRLDSLFIRANVTEEYMDELCSNTDSSYLNRSKVLVASFKVINLDNAKAIIINYGSRENSDDLLKIRLLPLFSDTLNCLQYKEKVYPIINDWVTITYPFIERKLPSNGYFTVSAISKDDKQSIVLKQRKF